MAKTAGDIMTADCQCVGENDSGPQTVDTGHLTCVRPRIAAASADGPTQPGRGYRRRSRAVVERRPWRDPRLEPAPADTVVVSRPRAAHGASARSKKSTTRRSYSFGLAAMPPTWPDSGISHSVAESPAAFA